MFLMLAFAEPVSAVVINQLLVNPEGNDAGNEFIEFYNEDSSEADLSNWTIEMASTTTKVVRLPEGTVLKQGSLYRIAESEGKGELKAGITLRNNDGWVVLKDKEGKVQDIVGWEDAERFEGEAVPKVEEGKAFLRIKDTGNNKQDFVLAEPTIYAANGVSVIIEIEGNEEDTIEIPEDDDKTKPGIQITPKAGKERYVTVNTTSQIVFKDKTYDPANGKAVIPLHHTLAPGNYTITNKNGAKTTFEYLALKAFEVEGQKLFFIGSSGNILKGKQKARLRNIGNIAVEIAAKPKGTIAEWMELEEQITLNVGEEKLTEIKISVPKTARTGFYTGSVEFENE